MAKARVSESNRSGPDPAPIEPVLHRFEDAWRRGLTPAIEDYLPAGNGPRAAVLRELVLADLEYRWKTKCPVVLEDYLRRFPDLAHDRQTALELINAEFEVRQRFCAAVNFSEYERRFPQYREDLASGLKTALVACQPAGHLSSCPRCRQPLTEAVAAQGTCPGCGQALAGVTQTADAEPPLPAFPDYEILHELGRGSMGIVYKARQIGRGRLVALKVIRRELMASPLGARRFLREAEVAARLAHPNVVGVYETGQAGNQHFMALEFVEGTNLQQLTEKGGPLAVPLACAMIREAALGLQHAFEQGLVHRDVKPANLIHVSRTGAGEPQAPGAALVKVLDLGLARLHENYRCPTLRHVDPGRLLSGDAGLHRAGAGRRTRSRPTSAPTCTASGCTFYFLLTGRVPFPGGTLLQKLDHHRWKSPPLFRPPPRDAPRRGGGGRTADGQGPRRPLPDARRVGGRPGAPGFAGCRPSGRPVGHCPGYSGGAGPGNARRPAGRPGRHPDLHPGGLGHLERPPGLGTVRHVLPRGPARPVRQPGPHRRPLGAG